MAALAQLVEHWIVIPEVTGSSPVCRPTTSVNVTRRRRLFAERGQNGSCFVAALRWEQSGARRSPLVVGLCVLLLKRAYRNLPSE